MIPFYGEYMSCHWAKFYFEESQIGEKSQELKKKDEVIAEKEKFIQDKSSTIQSLQNEVASLQVSWVVTRSG